MKTEIKNTIQNVWFAGLGVASLAQKETVKVYENLIKEGKTLETKSKKTVNQVSKEAEKRFNSIRKVAEKQMNKVEGIFDSRIEKALKKFDIPTIKDIKGLGTKVEKLVKEIQTIEAKKVA
jgi:poly(hydroxyalkanoate) granule-associated protein